MLSSAYSGSRSSIGLYNISRKHSPLPNEAKSDKGHSISPPISASASPMGITTSPVTVAAPSQYQDPLHIVESIHKGVALVLSGEEEHVVHGVTREIYDQAVRDQYELSSSSLRFDLRSDTRELIIRRPTIGHEILAQVFNSHVNFSNYHGSTIMLGGAADVDLVNGVKSPDYSFYQMPTPQKQELQSMDYDSTEPTVTCEVAYSQRAAELNEVAARTLCGTLGRVRLVIAINLETLPESRIVQTMTWYHWEVVGWEDVDAGMLAEGLSFKFVDKATSTSHRLAAFVRDEDGSVAKITAAVVLKQAIIPETQDRHNIPILHRHLYRDPVEEDADIPVLQLVPRDIRKIVTLFFQAKSLQDTRKPGAKKRPREDEQEARHAIRAYLSKEREAVKKRARLVSD